METTMSKPDFDKYYYYKLSVQSPDVDVEFFQKEYRTLTKREPVTFREDFCGTFSLCCEWVKLDPNYQAIGYDLDSEPLQYGKEHYFSLLSDDQKSRVKVEEADVLSEGLQKADIICAVNFSYFIFKEREQLKSYFQNAHKGLNEDGVFILDIFGGSQCQEANEEETEHEDEGFSYYWDQDNFNPVNNHAQFYIHFRRHGEKKRREVFSYDWRLWTIPEIREILQEAGFSKSHVYWEGTDEDGGGDGEFTRTEEGEECEGWIAYIFAEK